MVKYRIVQNKYGYYKVQMKVLCFWIDAYDKWSNTKSFQVAKEKMKKMIDEDKRYDNDGGWKIIKEG